MELSKAILSRRSIRSYSNDCEISRNELEELISAALMAPSWKNSQTGRYYIVSEPDKVNEVRSQCLPEFNQNNSRNAATLIITAFEMDRAGFSPEKVAVNECGQGWGYYDLGLQNQNLLLKATELGLATLVMGIRDADKLRELLDIPETQQIVAVIAVGKTQISPDMPRRKNIDEIAKFY